MTAVVECVTVVLAAASAVTLCTNDSASQRSYPGFIWGPSCGDPVLGGRRWFLYLLPVAPPVQLASYNGIAEAASFRTKTFLSCRVGQMLRCPRQVKMYPKDDLINSFDE